MILRHGNLPIVTTEQMQQAEHAAIAAGVSQDILMEQAGKAVADAVQRIANRRPILLAAGPGNNGGDAYVAARLLTERGHDVTVAALGSPKTGAATRMADRWLGNKVDFFDARPEAVFVDGLFGTGTTRPLDDKVIRQLFDLHDAATFTLAIDLPSGVVADTGDDLGASLGFDATIALGALKPAHLIGESVWQIGEILFDDIGIECGSPWRSLYRPLLSPPNMGHQKFSRGMVVVLAGAMPGAAALAAEAAMRGGAGYVVMAGGNVAHGPPHALIRRTVGDPSELGDLLNDKRIGTVLVGPGLGRNQSARWMLDQALACPHALVIDGDALSLLGNQAIGVLQQRKPPTCLTPHSGEFDRMFGSGGGDKITRTLSAATSSKAIVVHKGSDTVIARPDGRVIVTPPASAWLSTAGTGDVLAGLIASRWSTDNSDTHAPMDAVWLHSRAAELAGIAFTADSLIDYIPCAIAECL